MKLAIRSLLMMAMLFFAPVALCDDKGAGDGGNGGGSGGGGSGGGDKKPEAVMITREELDRLIAEAAKGKGKDDKGGGGGGDGGDPLLEKVEKDRKERERTQSDSKSIESALKFTLGLEDFVKTNADLLPSEVAELVHVAKGEKYDTEVAKAAAVKASILRCYFSQQANVDSLTESQKRDLDEYNKLTKTGREEKASTIYANIFEPSLEMNRRLKRAEELRRGDSGILPSGTEAAYRQKMVDASMKKYFPGK